MRLIKAQVQKYRSIRDTGIFDVDLGKTIFVGPNESGKTALFRALQQINPPAGTPKFEALRDYPRSEYNDITSGKVKPGNVTVVTGWFQLDLEDKSAIPELFRECVYVIGRQLNNFEWHKLEGGPEVPQYVAIFKDLLRLAAHVDGRLPKPADGQAEPPKPSAHLADITKEWTDDTLIEGKHAADLKSWLDGVLKYVEEGNTVEEERFDKLSSALQIDQLKKVTQDELRSRLPVFVLFSNYYRVRPLIHLGHLAQRLQSNILDDKQYDYGNECLLKLLGFTAQQLYNLGNVAEPAEANAAEFKNYRDRLDRRSYQLNAASVQLTEHIVSVWMPDKNRDEATRLRIVVDKQYLKVVVEDEHGVEIELDQRSEGFQWLVSFFVVFFAEAKDNHKNAVLLLDEPGLSLHGLKQRDFRQTISRLSENNQTLYTTHLPFLVGPDELDQVRVVEMTDRRVGTKVLTSLTASDSAGLLPLQEALGYDLAQSLFAQQRSLVLEGLTDYWYIEAMAHLLRDGGAPGLDQRVALIPAASAGKIVYFATMLHAQKLKVAALLDSDALGEQAARQDTLVHMLGNKRVLRTRDAYRGAVQNPEIEELLRSTLIGIAMTGLNWDISMKAAIQPERSIVDIFVENIPDFSKFRLAKAFLHWCSDHKLSDLTADEQSQWGNLIMLINQALE